MAQTTPNCTNTLQRVTNVVQNFIRNAPLTFSGTNDPALLLGDWVRDFMLGPPFAWRWNRATVPLTLVAGQQDYQTAVPDFGWLECVTIKDTASPPNSYEMEIRLDIGEDTTQNQPRAVAAEYDDNNGNITFRFLPVPMATYTANVTYQLAPPKFTAMTDFWAPIPDYLSHLYFQGLLAKSYEYFGDTRFQVAMPLFLRQVIAANGGLDETQLNIFLSERLVTARESDPGKEQMIRSARGMY
jgi:hypothetical protein